MTNITFGASGDYSDYQVIKEKLKKEGKSLKINAGIDKTDPK